MRAKRTSKSAIIDHLTGLYNRRHFDYCLKKSIAEAKRKKGHFSLLMIDIDKFKDVNDKYGHLTGDKVLNDLAKVLKKSVRKVDICFRYGGDEIAVILPNTEKNAAENVVARIERKVEPFKFTVDARHKLRLKLSIGLAVYPDDGLKPKLLIKRADELLYKAKRQKSSKKKIAEPFILETKLVAPILKENTISRPRLLTLLKKNLKKKLMLITADAGYGKTTLLAQLCAELQKSFMFYYVDASDNDLVTFFSYILTGIKQYYTDFGQRTKNIVGQTRDSEILVGTFINEFAENIKDEFYIILDDYHHLQQNKEINKATDYLLRHLPANLHIIIASRSIPSLNLAYYFAKQDLFRLEKRQLQFDMDEIKLLLKNVYGLKVPNAEIERIEKHSEGWITAIQLILQKISAAGEEKVKETLNGYVASGEEVFNYFASEVFKDQPRKVQTFLMKTSILEEMSSDACNYLLKTKNSGKVLRYLDTRNMFITKSNSHIHKYHPLFKGFLQSELKNNLTPKQIFTLNNRIAVFFEKKNLVELAITHYLYCQKIQCAIKLVLKNIPSYMNAGRIGIVENWLSSITEKYYNKYPRLYMYLGQLLQIKGLWEEARQAFNKAKDIFQGSKSKRMLAKVWFELGTISSIQGDMIRARKELTQAKRVCKRLDPRIKIAISNCMTIIMSKQSNFKGAEKHFLAGIKKCHKYRQYSGLHVLLCNLGVVYSRQGNFGKAEQCYSKSIKLAEGGAFGIDMPVVYGNLAKIKMLKGQYEQAMQLLRKGLNLSEKYQNMYTLCHNYRRMGHLYKYLEKYTESLEYFNKAIGIATNLNLKEALLETQCAIGDLYLSNEDIETSKEYFVSSQRLAAKNHDDNVNLWFLKGKIKLAEKNYRNAENIFKKILLRVHKNGMSYDAFRCYILLAQIYERTGKNRRLLTSLKEAVKLSKLYDYQNLLQKELSNQLIKIAEKYNINLGITAKPMRKITKSVASHILRVEFFGKPIILYNNHPIKSRWFTDKAKKLLCYFITHHDQKLAKEKILEQIWPECDIRKGESRFYFTLHYVRKALAVKKRKVYHREIIFYKDKSYILDPEITVSSDVSEFEGLINQAKIAHSNNDRVKASSLLNRAITIYRAPFCEGWYDNWIEEIRQVYENMYLKALSLLAEINFRKKLYEECIDYSKKYLTVDRYNEEMNRKLILSLFNLGARQKAITHYENFCKIFGKLNIEPTEEILALRKKLYS